MTKLRPVLCFLFMKALLFPLKYFRSFNLKKTVSALFICSCIYLSVNLILSLIGPNIITIPKIDPEKIKAPFIVQKNARKPLEYYVDILKKRQLFTEEKGAGQAALIAGPELMKNLILVGIISGEKARAVIEDKQAFKTYYVSKGQSIGQFQLVDILEGKIILNYGGQIYELNL